MKMLDGLKALWRSGQSSALPHPIKPAPQPLDTRAWAWRRYDGALRKTTAPEATVFEAEDYCTGSISNADVLAREIAAAERIAFSADQTSPGYITYQFNSEQIESFNASSHFRVIGPSLVASLQRMIDRELREPVANALGSPWRVLNLRTWSTPPAARTEHMYGWHTDGFVEQIFKIMIYLTPMTKAFGILEIKKHGEPYLIENNKPGSWVLFKNSSIEHRGVPGTEAERLSVEITLCRAAEFDLTIRQPGLNAHWPEFPIDPHFINVGGGPMFFAPGWINLEGNAGPNNPEPFELSPSSVFPASAGSVELVYTSHALEHLDDATVRRILHESRRVLSPSGRLLIIIPDFDALLAAYRAGNISYFGDETWNFPVVTLTLKNRDMKDSLAVRAAWLFCGFWNRAFGNLFGEFSPLNAGAYNGPPVLSERKLTRILRSPSPHEIAAILRARVLEMEIDFTFNHQNAWSRTEMEALLNSHGFKLLSQDNAALVSKFHAVPGIAEMLDISAYYLAAPKEQHNATWPPL